MSDQPKSILKKRARSPAVAPTTEEAPTTKGLIPSQEPINIPSSEDESQEEEDEEDFSAGSDDDELEEGDEDDEDAIRDMLEDGQERPAKSKQSSTKCRKSLHYLTK